MANDAYELQGLNGWELIDSGQVFTGRSRGFQVIVDGAFSATNSAPLNLSSELSAAPLVAGLFIGGIITSLAPSDGGAALVYPLDADYTIA